MSSRPTSLTEAERDAMETTREHAMPYGTGQAEARIGFEKGFTAAKAFYSERERAHEESRQALRTTLAATLERERALREALEPLIVAAQWLCDRTLPYGDARDDPLTKAAEALSVARAALKPTDPAPSTTEGGPDDL